MFAPVGCIASLRPGLYSLHTKKRWRWVTRENLTDLYAISFVARLEFRLVLWDGF